jgi:chorismate mutase
MSSSNTTSIKELRQEIEGINAEIIELIANRVEVAQKIGEQKKKKDISVHQPKREKRVLRLCKEQAETVGLDKGAIEDIFDRIIKLSRKRQKD